MRRRGQARQLRVLSLSRSSTMGWLEHCGRRWRCALGRSGQRVSKREGDGATPVGVWPVREAFYRADRGSRPRSGLPLRVLRPDDGWCDGVGDRNYNRLIRHPYPASAEHMWRVDGLYDLVVVLGYNDAARVQGRGSAIFMHLAHRDWRPTAGCIALRRGDLLQMLAVLDRRCRFCIGRPVG